MTLILGALRMLWLRGLSAMFGAWLSPMLMAAIGVLGAGAIALGAYLLWPSGNALERAVLDALGQRKTITNLNIDEEKRDNAWLEEWEKNTAAQREAAASAAGAVADRVIWHDDDPWLRAKRPAKARCPGGTPLPADRRRRCARAQPAANAAAGRRHDGEPGAPLGGR